MKSKKNVIKKAYSFDATGISREPEEVIFAENLKDVIEAVKYCLKKKKALIPRGAGTGFTGGSVPVRGGVVLSLEKMNRIIDIDTKNMVAEVEPGVITGELQRSCEELGFMYPPDPSSLDYCTIGGNIAENAGGPRAVKYGVTADYVIGVEAVIGTAEVINTLKRVKKNVVGYQITQLFVGSEGTLGVITRALLKIVPQPEERKLMLIYFSLLEDAADVVVKTLASGNKPSAMEIMDTTSLECVEKYKGIEMPKGTEAVLLVELDGKKSEVKETEKLIKKLANEKKAKVKIANNEQEEEKLWLIRRAISPSLRKIAPTKINEDVVVPVDKLPEAFRRFKKISKLYGIPVVCFGHAGDGNIHVNIMTDREDEKQWQKALKATRDLFISVVELGGVLSGEHGIGITKEKFLPLQVKKEEITLWRRIKSAFDPENIINPGKMGLL